MRTSFICLIAVVLTVIAMLAYGEMSTRKYTQPLYPEAESHPASYYEWVHDTLNIVEISIDGVFYVVDYNDTLCIIFSDDTRGDLYIEHELKQVVVYAEDLIPYKAR